LAIFPVYELGVELNSASFVVPEKWYQDVVTFLTFNCMCTIGSLMPDMVPKIAPKWISIGVIVRALVVFAFYAVCNFKPDERNMIPVLITNDYVYWFGSALSPFLFGFFTSSIMMLAPK
jgi:equilibrative nucleoside transporter 1/2/3